MFLDSQPKQVSEHESSQTPSVPKLKGFVDVMESAGQNQTENVAKCTEGMTVVWFYLVLSKKERYVFVELGRWPWELNIQLVVTEKIAKGSQIPDLKHFVRLLSTSKYLKKYFENDCKFRIERKKWQMCF